MSAWYVMSAMGFYPVCPGSGEYVTVTPLFDRVTIHTGQEDILIAKSDWTPGLFWDGKSFSSKSSNLFDASLRIPPAPWFSDWQQRFKDSTFVTLDVRGMALAAADDGSLTTVAPRIYYTTDGRLPDINSILYQNPILVNRDITLRAVSYDPQTRRYSPVVQQQLTRFIADKQLRYLTEPAPQYAENGPEGLIDRLYGTPNYRIGGWQGWQGDMEVVVDLLQNKTLTSVAVDCLDNMEGRFWTAHACQQLGIPVAYGAIAGWFGQACTVYPGDPSFATIYGEIAGESAHKRLGNLPSTAYAIAAIQAAEAVKVLLDKPSQLRNRLFMLDLLDGSAECIELR